MNRRVALSLLLDIAKGASLFNYVPATRRLFILTCAHTVFPPMPTARTHSNRPDAPAVYFHHSSRYFLYPAGPQCEGSLRHFAFLTYISVPLLLYLLPSLRLMRDQSAASLPQQPSHTFKTGAETSETRERTAAAQLQLKGPVKDFFFQQLVVSLTLFLSQALSPVPSPRFPNLLDNRRLFSNRDPKNQSRSSRLLNAINLLESVVFFSCLAVPWRAKSALQCGRP